MTAAGLLLANESARGMLCDVGAGGEVTVAHVADACIKPLTFQRDLRTGLSTTLCEITRELIRAGGELRASFVL